MIRRMVWAIRHRGPDALGYYLDDHAALGQSRLSIVDLASGFQPMTNEDETLWIVFNGEIYNHLELRPELEHRGHRFQTKCDTEVILHLYEDYGPECVHRMNGQFAFAIWDRARKEAFLARDRFGVRPLFFTVDASRLLFASEIKSLFAVSDIRRAFDPVGLGQTFAFWSPQAPHTPFDGIRQLPAGHTLLVREGSTDLRRYWSMPFHPSAEEEDLWDEEYYVERLLDELIRATRLRLRADVPVAAYLSGGLDSSLTAAIVRQYTGAELATFSIRFEDPAYDEGPYQDEMTSHLGTRHHSVTVGKRDIAEAFPEVVFHAETPILRAAPVPLHLLSRLVRESGYKVVVTGEGADEMLAGYNIFKENKIRRFWAREPASPRRPLLLDRIYPYVQRDQRAGAAAYWRLFFGKGLTETSRACYSHLVRWENAMALRRLFAKDLFDQVVSRDCVAEYDKSLPGAFEKWDPLSQAQYIEADTFLTHYLLSSQGDRVSMSHAIEGRYPFLDHNFAELACRIPPKFRLRGLQEKHVLRRAAAGLVPNEILRRPKQPYRAPDSASFLGDHEPDYVKEMLSEAELREAGCFDPGAALQFFRQRRAKSRDAVSARDDMAFLGILSVQLLYYLFVKRPAVPEDVPDDAFRVRIVRTGVPVGDSVERTRV